MRRVEELEGLRGIASIVVLFHHCTLAFAPRLIGLLDHSPGSLHGTPLYAIVNGSAAVIVFFVLSGFVLTLYAMQRASIRSLAGTAIRRWPRLAGPILIVNLGAALLFISGMNANVETATVVHSTWLGFQLAFPPTGWADMIGAGKEALFTVFVDPHPVFNSNLWTMAYEFWGSFLALGLAAATILIGRPLVYWPMIAIAWAVAAVNAPFLACFVAGVGLARFYADRPSIVAPPAAALVVLAITTYLVGYQGSILVPSENYGVYRWILPLAQLVPNISVHLHTLAALALIWLALSWEPIGSLLRTATCKLMGRISFAIYLVHPPIILSAGCISYLAIQPLNNSVAKMAAIGASIATSFLLAWLVMQFDIWWRGTLAPIGPSSKVGVAPSPVAHVL